VDSFIIADILFYSIEIAQSFTQEKPIKQEAFYKSMLNTFEQAISFTIEKGIFYDFKNRVEAIVVETTHQKWLNQYQFESILKRFDY
jgi:hypothetical protein